MTATLDTPPANPDWKAALDLIGRRANQPGTFSSNDIRAELRELGFGNGSTGRLFQIAEASGTIRQTGLTRSTERRTRSRVVQWEGVRHKAETATFVRARRGPDGRFTAGRSEAAPVITEALFEVFAS